MTKRFMSTDRRGAVASGIAIAVLVGATSLHAQEWPEWRGPARDGQALGLTTPGAGPRR
jgi:hypothetical protein